MVFCLQHINDVFINRISNNSTCSLTLQSFENFLVFRWPCTFSDKLHLRHRMRNAENSSLLLKLHISTQSLWVFCKERLNARLVFHLCHPSIFASLNFFFLSGASKTEISFQVKLYILKPCEGFAQLTQTLISYIQLLRGTKVSSVAFWTLRNQF